MLTQPHCWQHQVLQLQRCTSEWRDGRRWENEEKGGKEWRYIKTQSSQIFRSSSSALPSALPDLDSASASAAHVGNTDVTGPRDLYILRERGSVFIVYGYYSVLVEFYRNSYSVVQTAVTVLNRDLQRCPRKQVKALQQSGGGQSRTWKCRLSWHRKRSTTWIRPSGRLVFFFINYYK